MTINEMSAAVLAANPTLPHLDAFSPIYDGDRAMTWREVVTGEHTIEQEAGDPGEAVQLVYIREARMKFADIALWLVVAGELVFMFVAPGTARQWFIRMASPEGRRKHADHITEIDPTRVSGQKENE
jgi:hypothetical protein